LAVYQLAVLGSLWMKFRGQNSWQWAVLQLAGTSPPEYPTS